jgi:ribonuclease I
MFKKTTTAAKEESRPSTAPSKRTPPEPRNSTTSSTANAAIPHDAIARLAFQNWQKHGCPVGDDQRDWFEAERELKSTPAGNARRG